MAIDVARPDLHATPPSYLLLDRQGRFIAEVAENGQEYGYWPVEPLPPRMMSLPMPPSSMSLPEPPLRVSAPLPPMM